MMLNGKYIQFADPVVKQICIANFSSDGIGVTYEDAAAVTSIGTLFRNASIVSFDEFRFFTGVTAINSNCFRGNSAMASVFLPNSITTVGQSAFEGCLSLTELTFPVSVTYIGNYAVYGRNMALALTMLPSVPPTLDEAQPISGAAVIYVPAASEAAYKAAWPNYASKIQAIS